MATNMYQTQPMPWSGGGDSPFGSTGITSPDQRGGGGFQFGSYYNDPALAHTGGLYDKALANMNKGLGDNPAYQAALAAMGGAGGPGGSGGGSSSNSSKNSMSFMGDDPLGRYRGGLSGGGSAGLASYAGSRDYMAPADYFRQYAEGLDPSQYSNELRQYAQGVDPNAAVNPLMQFLQNFDPTGGMNPYFESRIAQLQADPFTDQILAARRTGALDDFERDRQIAKQRVVEQMAAMGHDQSSGLVARQLQNVDRNYDQQRASRTNELVNQEFDMRRENLAAADALQLQRGQLNMQGQQLIGNLTGQVGQLMQQGLGLESSLRTSLAQMGLQEQSQQTQIIGQVSSLMAQGMQMEDALQTALASTRTQEMGIRGQLQGALAGAEASVYGSKLGLQGQLAQARATSGASRAANQLGWAQLANDIFQQDMANPLLQARVAGEASNIGTNPMDILKFFQ